MKKTVVLVCLILLVQNLLAQKDVSESYANIISINLLKKHLTVIASAEMEGRETGTIGQRKAAAYIEAQFKAIGLKAPVALNGSYQQLYPLNQDSMDVTASLVKIDNSQLVYGTDYFVTAINNSNKTIDGSQFVFVGYGISDDKYDEYKNLDVTGKVVVMLLGEPKAGGKYLLTGSAKNSKYTYPGVAVKMQIAAQKGAIAAIVINPAMPLLTERVVANNSKTAVYYPAAGKGDKTNYLVASFETAKRVFAKSPIDSLINAAKPSAIFETTHYEQINASFNFQFKKEKQVIKASNVLGVVEGSDKKDEYVFVTGHYDHLGIRGDIIYYGADDDGSGTCGVMAMAEAFAKAKADGQGPRRTMVFMTVSGEEKGLWGSQYYSENPIYPLDKTSVDLNIDMVGRLDTERNLPDTLNYVYVIGHDKLSSDLPVINEAANNKYTNLVLDYKYDDPQDVNRIYFRSDHYNFARKGVPVLFFYDGMLKADYHKPTDTIEKINWDLYQKRIKLIFYTAWEIANRNEMLKRDLPPVEGER